MNRIEKIREYVDGVIAQLEEESDKRVGYVHLYGVSQAAAILADRRGENVELAVIAGMLHDIYTYESLDWHDHAHKGALRAEEIMGGMNLFTEEEIHMVSRAVYHHSDKAEINTSFDEVIKDADVFQHSFYDPMSDVAPHEKERYLALKKELDLK